MSKELKIDQWEDRNSFLQILEFGNARNCGNCFFMSLEGEKQEFINCTIFKDVVIPVNGSNGVCKRHTFANDIAFAIDHVKRNQKERQEKNKENQNNE